MKRYIPPKALQPAIISNTLLCKLASKDMAMFRFLLEAYDGLALFTVIEPQSALIKISYSPHEEKKMHDALSTIHELVPLEIIPYNN